MLWLFGYYLRLRRLPWVLYRLFLSPQIGTLGNDKCARPLRFKNNFKAQAVLKTYPKISVVTPSYNQANYIGQTMESVVGQNYPNLEYVVMDGASKDNTIEVLKRYAPRLSFWASQKDGGQTNALNLGFAKTSGEIMAYLNSDDLFLPGSLEYVAQYFTAHPEVDVLYGHRVLINSEGWEIGRWILPKHNNEIIQNVDFVPQETLFWRRSIWEKAGGKFDEAFHYAMDWDLIVRFMQSGARMARVPVFLGAFRVHQQQKTTAALDVGTTEVERIRKRVLGRIPKAKETGRKIRTYLLRARFLEVMWKLRLLRFEME